MRAVRVMENNKAALAPVVKGEHEKLKFIYFGKHDLYT